jgi:WD40 repeat protein
MDISPNDRFIAATVHNGKRNGSRIIVWNALDGPQLLVVPIAHGRKAEGLAFSSDGQLLATGCHGGILKTWEFIHEQSQGSQREEKTH